jgi:hypothetical protein
MRRQDNKPERTETGLVRGRLCLRAFDKQGVELWKESGANLVVNSGYEFITKILAELSGPYIAQIAVGENGDPAQASDTSLTNPEMFGFTTVSYPYARAIRFDFQIAYSDCAGKTIREFGLITSDGRLFARKIRSEPIEKTTHFSIVGKWELYILDGVMEDNWIQGW